MKRVKRFFRSQRSQGLTEFALVAPVLFLIIFGIFDVGRAVVCYVAIQHAANEGGRIASEGFDEGGSGAAFAPPTTVEVTNATISDAAVVKLSQAPNSSCPNGPIPSLTTLRGSIPANQGWVFVTDPETSPFGGVVDSPNLPGGDPSTTTPPAGCGGKSTVYERAGGGAPLQVTVIYHYNPILSVFLGPPGKPIIDFVMVAYSNYETEY